MKWNGGVVASLGEVEYSLGGRKKGGDGEKCWGKFR